MARRYLLFPPVKVRPPPTSYQPTPPPSSSVTSFPILAISILGMLTTAVLLVSYYVFVIKCCINWRRSDVISRLSETRYSRRQRRREDDPVAAAVGRRGLEEAVIRAIPVFRFKRGNGGVGGGGGGGGLWDAGKAGAYFHECAVCLNEFVEGERLRRLPSCSHAFHIDCIDVWLQSSVNCPLCRSDITSATLLRTGQTLSQGAHRHSGFVVIEVRDDGSDGAGDVVTPRAEASMMQQRQAPASPGAAQGQLSPRKAAAQRTAQGKGPGRFHHVCSMGDECIDVRRGGKDEQFCVQPMRRSFSVDSSCDRRLYLCVQEILQRDPRLHPREIVAGAGEGDSSSSVLLAAGRARRSFFSFGRGSRSNAVLPMALEP